MGVIDAAEINTAAPATQQDRDDVGHVAGDDAHAIAPDGAGPQQDARSLAPDLDDAPSSDDDLSLAQANAKGAATPKSLLSMMRARSQDHTDSQYVQPARAQRKAARSMGIQTLEAHHPR